VEAPRVRRGGPGDAAELTRLRGLMFEAMGRSGDDAWKAACTRQLQDRLGADEELLAVVVDAPDGGGLACAVVGTLDRRLPSPENPVAPALVGHVSSMSTDPRWQRQGMARAALRELLDRFAARGARSVTLSATEVGEPLYRALGFTEPPHPHLRLRLPSAEPSSG
jgi:GNAT superfamily N-acetyltransferase